MRVIEININDESEIGSGKCPLCTIVNGFSEDIFAATTLSEVEDLLHDFGSACMDYNEMEHHISEIEMAREEIQCRQEKIAEIAERYTDEE